MAGKGDGRRTGADDKAYAEGWERIFGQKEEPAEELVPIWDNDFNDIQEDSPQ